MASNVLVNYQNKNIEKFIEQTDQAQNSISKLNANLLALQGGKGFSNTEKQVKELESSEAKLVKTNDEVNKSFDKSFAIIGKVTKVATENAETVAKQTGLFEKLPKPIQKATESMSRFTGASKEEEKQGVKLNLGLLNIIKNFTKLPPPILGAVGALIAFKVASKVIEVFGNRASKLTAVAQSFDRLAMSAGLSSDFLANFTENADNQLTQGESLILINKALAGSTGDFTKELADSLPTLLEFARARAAATGEDVSFLFESLIQGIKKTQPLILDNLGLVFDLNQTYEQYALTLGKTADQLTGVEQQQAVLEATNREAIRNIAILGEATLSNADKISARGNIYGDIADNISLSLQPLLGLFLDIEIFFARLIGDTLQPFIDIFSSIVTMVVDPLKVAFDALRPVIETVFVLIQALASPFVMLFQIASRVTQAMSELLANMAGFTKVFSVVTSVLQVVVFLFQTLGNLVVGLIDFLSHLFRVVAQSIGGLFTFGQQIDKVNQYILNAKDTIVQLSQVMAVGFGRATASMVNSFLKAGIHIVRIAANIAQGIADFLLGNSPPPKGPLSKMREGARNTFESFLDGFTSVSLKPVAVVARKVDMALGNIGSMSLPQVESRLSQLDKALQPFSEQLEIAKARFESISAPAEAALNAIDRQLDKAVEALTKGDESAKASVRALDAQRASLYKNLDLQKQQVEFAEIEFALKKAQQAEERVLLQIQQKRLSGQPLTQTEKLLEKQIKAKRESEKEAKKPTGSASPLTGAGGNTARASQNQTGSGLGDLALAGFNAEINPALLAEFGTELDRLGEGTSGIAEGLGGIGDRFTEPFDNLFGEDGTLTNLFGDFFGEGGTLSTFFNDSFGEGSDIRNSIISLFSNEGFFANAVNGLFGEGSTMRNTILGMFGVNGFIASQLIGLFGEDSTLRSTVLGFFGEEGFFSNQLLVAEETFIGFKDSLTDVVNLIIGVLTGDTDSITSALEALFSIEEGTLGRLLNTGKLLFDTFFALVFGPEGVLAGVGQSLTTTITAPMLAVLSGLEAIINGFIITAETFVNDVLSSVGSLVELIPQQLRGPLANLTDTELSFGRIQFVAPSVPEAYEGGLFSGGLLSVGERGQEYVSSASKMAVFPNNFVTAVESLENVLASYLSIPSGSNIQNSSTNSVNTSNQTININQPMNPSTIRQQLNMI